MTHSLRAVGGLYDYRRFSLAAAGAAVGEEFGSEAGLGFWIGHHGHLHQALPLIRGFFAAEGAGKGDFGG
ncbi:hypothetical protein K8Q93_02680 [Candidatus Parcubacteria bacterium]|nr:hypothetical protein [Candidatus Parcubacteria bacterium]